MTRFATTAAALLAALALALPARPAGAQGPRAVATGAAATFAAADAHADSAPIAATVSVRSLAAYLARAGSDEATRARAVYRWIVRHVDYDVAGFLAGRPGDVSPEAVLARRTAVCDGYAQLTAALGSAMGLRVAVIRGWSKGYGYTPGLAFSGETNHAWNAVSIDGQWRLLDATWGAGHLNEQLQFVRQQQDHYFLTRPDAFVYDHLPSDPKWQLLERPLSGQEYGELAYLRPGFFRAGLAVRSHPTTRIASDGRVRVTFGFTDPVSTWVTVTDTAGRRLDGNWAMAQVEGPELAVHAAFPAPGAYLLRIFARPRARPGNPEWALDYGIDAAAGHPDLALATVYDLLNSVGGRLFEPLDGVLRVGRAYRFRLRVPGALDVAVVANGAWTHLARAGEEFTGELSAVRGDINVFAKFSEGDQYQALVAYVGR
jgi:hypothetical protein